MAAMATKRLMRGSSMTAKRATTRTVVPRTTVGPMRPAMMATGAVSTVAQMYGAVADQWIGHPTDTRWSCRDADGNLIALNYWNWAGEPSGDSMTSSSAGTVPDTATGSRRAPAA